MSSDYFVTDVSDRSISRVENLEHAFLLLKQTVDEKGIADDQFHSPQSR